MTKKNKTISTILIALIIAVGVAGAAVLYSDTTDLQGRFVIKQPWPGFKCNKRKSSVVVSEVTSEVTSTVISGVPTDFPSVHVSKVPSLVTSKVTSLVPSCVLKPRRQLREIEKEELIDPQEIRDPLQPK